MGSVELFDLLKLENLYVLNPEREIRIRIISSGGMNAGIMDTLTPEENLITKAARAYLKRAGISAEVTISLEKNIPAGAGLGGGSSDAAATLRLLNRHLGKMGPGDLAKAGAVLGADVPYCLGGGFALCEGTGDRIEKIQGTLGGWVLIAHNDIHVDTRWAYGRLDGNRCASCHEQSIEEKKDRFRKGLAKGNIRLFRDILRNDFEQPVFQEYPALRSLKEQIEGFRPDYVAMTGSGSSLVGIFPDRKKALNAKRALKGKVRQVCVYRFVGPSPEGRMIRPDSRKTILFF